MKEKEAKKDEIPYGITRYRIERTIANYGKSDKAWVIEYDSELETFSIVFGNELVIRDLTLDDVGVLRKVLFEAVRDM